jgi:ketosteroid isomerase-like protein
MTRFRFQTRLLGRSCQVVTERSRCGREVPSCRGVPHDLTGSDVSANSGGLGRESPVKKLFVACALALTVTAATPTVVSSQGQKGTDSDAVAAITKFENDAMKAALANDAAFYEKFLAADYTGGTSRGTWDTKPSTLADMKDTKNNKTNSQTLSDLKVRIHGDLAIATYSTTYDALIQGQHYARTVLCSDVLQQQKGAWMLMANHCSQAAK